MGRGHLGGSRGGRAGAEANQRDGREGRIGKSRQGDGLLPGVVAGRRWAAYQPDRGEASSPASTHGAGEQAGPGTGARSASRQASREGSGGRSRPRRPNDLPRRTCRQGPSRHARRRHGRRKERPSRDEGLSPVTALRHGQFPESRASARSLARRRGAREPPARGGGT
ncbi:hypothetical protein AKJ08_1681 [Vulgatibacter incomptus]|uniref:Uncharacterized protein n=1 Tax=Vulgatibacter incomptus TaxID=1391653 RepID=A0A0K1PDV3_9BACT|nr:hypothetical protein AKJ08_1681 [Vulgatibacter incomptus]